jgi:serine/threonine protein kinase
MHKSCPCVIHKDLKASNTLLDQNLTSKLGDVGIASVAPELAAATFTGVTLRRGVSGAMRTSIVT